MYENNYLSHFGIKGQRWGVRRFQNADGTLNRAGKKQKTDAEKQETKDKVVKVAKVGATAAALLGAAYVANKYGGRAIRSAAAAKNSARPAVKAARTRQMRKGMGYYKNYKTGVNIKATFPTTTITRGSSFLQSSSTMTQTLGQITQSTLGLGE